MITAADFTAHPFFPFIWEGRPLFGRPVRVKAGRVAEFRPVRDGLHASTLLGERIRRPSVQAARLRAMRTGRGWLELELELALLGELARRRLPAAL